VTRIVLLEGDITDQQVDAIVNAANSALVLGAGVAGAIASRGGASIAKECAAIGPIEIGASALTGAGDLPAGAVIHAAGMPPGGQASAESVGAAVRSALELASRSGFLTVALPAIGAGIGGFSLQRCAEISLEEARRIAAAGCSMQEIRFVLYGEPAFRVFEMVQDAVKVEAQMRKLERR
jgi:O-acetyl-ADP-ribose deacetylase (regulator of RNase III)